MMLVGVWLALAFWIVEALVHTFIFQEGEFMNNLLPAEPNELWMRTLVCFLLLAFGIYAHFAMTKLKISKEEQLRLQGHPVPATSVPRPSPIPIRSPMISLGLLGAVGFWILESLIHTSIFHDEGFLPNLFPHDLNELWMRTLVSGLLIALGIYGHVSIRKLRSSEAERLELQRQLEDSLTKVLSGFIPICANCKKIREEDDAWIQIDGYIEKHSDAQFSHGICPECAKLIYPDYAEDK
jgi:hypothetical protein